jgi:fatty-acyl-CoA synthase
MARLAVEGEFDLAAVAGAAAALPGYARPLFLRVTPTPDLTATFKHRKSGLVDEGFDPDRVAEPLYVFDRVRGAYRALDRATFERIRSGAMRL